MNYEESCRALYALGRELGAPRQPARSDAPGARVQKFGLENISTLAAALGNPQKQIPCAHIAGTNGKGSTAAMLESIVRAAGLKTALYTSPHLERINERIRKNGEEISNEAFAAAWTRVHAAIESLMASGKLPAHPTFFECITAMAFVAFAEAHVEFAIYEVGLGGRLDATNIVEPEVAVITPVDFDHENFLGNSIASIAAEKAGIIKRGAIVVTSQNRPEALAVIARRAKEFGAPLLDVNAEWALEDIKSSAGLYTSVVHPKNSPDQKISIAPLLPGRFQLQNALMTAVAAKVLSRTQVSISDEAIERGISSARWPGRLERIFEKPDVYLDGAHNPAGAKELLKFWNENFAGRKIILVYGAMRDKAVDEITGLLFPRADTVILTTPRQPRAISATVLAEMTADFAPHALAIADPAKAVQHAIQNAQHDDAIFVTGSLYLVGDVRDNWSKGKFSHASESHTGH